MNILQQLKTEITDLRKKNIYNYSYQYWRGDENGMSLDPDMNEKYGSDRSGYDIYKNSPWQLEDGSFSEPGQINCSYSGITSLRTVTNRKTDTVIGYVTETKLSQTPAYDSAKEIYDQALEVFKNELKVQDVPALEYYLENNLNIFDHFGSDGVDGFKNSVEKLYDILDEYNEDEDFRHFFNKIIF